jgi:hypothetical protein
MPQTPLRFATLCRHGAIFGFPIMRDSQLLPFRFAPSALICGSLFSPCLRVSVVGFAFSDHALICANLRQAGFSILAISPIWQSLLG